MNEVDITVMAQDMGRVARRRNVMIATAESCTGGGVAAAITRISGSAKWFDRGFVTYHNLAKQQMLGVREATLHRYGAVSEAVARQMAAGALRRSQADIAVSVTGIAGPTGGTKDKPVGTVWFAWAAKGNPVQARMFRFKGDRYEVRRQTVAVALQGIMDLLR
jgi:nicotinamide-nucleotide amidase